jgi:MFS family permease
MHRAIKILIASSIFFSFSSGLFGPIYAIFVEKIGGDILTASSAWTLYSVVIGILILVFGKWEDKLNKRKMIVLGYFINTIGIAGYLFIQQPIQIFIIQAILGVSSAILNPAWNAIFSTSLDRHRESSEWAYWEGAIRIDAGIAAVIGGAIATIFGFHVLFVFMTITAAASTVISALFLRKKTWENFLENMGLAKF